jgi:hypothetical protein
MKRAQRATVQEPAHFLAVLRIYFQLLNVHCWCLANSVKQVELMGEDLQYKSLSEAVQWLSNYEVAQHKYFICPIISKILRFMENVCGHTVLLFTFSPVFVRNVFPSDEYNI